MNKIRSYHVETEIGSGDLEIFNKDGSGYMAVYHGLSGLAHVKQQGHEMIATNVDFKISNLNIDNLIDDCRSEIQKRDSIITSFA